MIVLQQGIIICSDGTLEHAISARRQAPWAVQTYTPLAVPQGPRQVCASKNTLNLCRSHARWTTVIMGAAE
jgi:hypothetical protein